MEENDEEEKEPIDTEFTERKADPESDENAFDFRLSDVQGEEVNDIANTNFIESLKSKRWEEFFKKVTGGLYDYYGILPKEKDKFEKIFWNNFEY